MGVFDDWLQISGHRLLRLRPSAPDATADLTAWVGFGVRPRVAHSGLFHVSAGATWEDFGNSIASAMFSDDSHPWEFHVPFDGKWTTTKREEQERFTCSSMIDLADFEQGDNQWDARECTVAEVVGNQWFCWFNFDFGDNWWLSCRFFTTTERVEVPPIVMDDCWQYPGCDGPGGDHSPASIEELMNAHDSNRLEVYDFPGAWRHVDAQESIPTVPPGPDDFPHDPDQPTLSFFRIQ